MKKYAIAYLILFLILLGLSHGVPFGIIIFERDHSMAYRPVIVRETVLIYNIIIMLACFVLAVILAKQKENVIKCKWMVPVIVFVCILFLSVGMDEEIQLFPPGHTREFWSIISLLTHEHYITIY